jgi:hypothetical protein
MTQLRLCDFSFSRSLALSDWFRFGLQFDFSLHLIILFENHCRMQFSFAAVVGALIASSVLGAPLSKLVQASCTLHPYV